MEILAEITGINYKIKCASKLNQINYSEFDINLMPSSCFLVKDQFNYGICKWVSPKRSRSYPYERIYNILSFAKRITIIPIVKDEGYQGDRDFIQWDTISLMSLFDVYVILGYYHKADKHQTKKDKITNQKFDSDYVKQKIIEINNYHSSALHWNLKEIRESLPYLIKKVKSFNIHITRELGIKLHDEKGIDKFEKQILQGLNSFMATSRDKAQAAQNREQKTIQPKEILSTLSKAKITIKNYLGGLYFFTTDEIELVEDKLFLIEAKYTKNQKLPNLSDIKDGLLKMILYSNLKNVMINEKKFKTIPVLKLSSCKLLTSISSQNNQIEINKFYVDNQFTIKQIELINNLFQESNNNKFLINIEHINK